VNPDHAGGRVVGVSIPVGFFGDFPAVGNPRGLGFAAPIVGTRSRPFEILASNDRAGRVALTKAGLHGWRAFWIPEYAGATGYSLNHLQT
jgi:hypothetical protein